MSLVKLLGFKTIDCGCVLGRYRDLSSERELTYVEEKGTTCQLHAHRRNHTVPSERQHRAIVSPLVTARAS
jgi:hypothetical protein